MASRIPKIFKRTSAKQRIGLGVIVATIIVAGAAVWYVYLPDEPVEPPTEEEQQAERAANAFGGEIVELHGDSMVVFHPRLVEEREFQLTNDTLIVNRNYEQVNREEISLGVEVNVMFDEETKEAVEIWYEDE